MISKITIEYSKEGGIVSLVHEGINQAELIGMLDLARVSVLNNCFNQTRKLIGGTEKPKTEIHYLRDRGSSNRIWYAARDYGEHNNCKYLEDIDLDILRKQRNVGRKTWLEIREIIEELKTKN